MRRWEKRRFFHRHWVPLFSEATMIQIGDKPFISLSDIPLDIYGYETDGDDAHDQRVVDDALKRGFVYGYWFSVKCIEGEWGSHALGSLTEITEAAFEAAKARGWK